jgi:hypothetical protein
MIHTKCVWFGRYACGWPERPAVLPVQAFAHKWRTSACCLDCLLFLDAHSGPETVVLGRSAVKSSALGMLLPWPWRMPFQH